MDMPKLQNMDLPKIDNPFVGGSAMWQSLNPPTQQMLPKEDYEKLSKEKTHQSGTVERERIQAIQKAKKQAIQKEEENGSAVVDGKEVIHIIPTTCMLTYAHVCSRMLTYAIYTGSRPCSLGSGS